MEIAFFRISIRFPTFLSIAGQVVSASVLSTLGRSFGRSSNSSTRRHDYTQQTRSSIGTWPYHKVRLRLVTSSIDQKGDGNQRGERKKEGARQQQHHACSWWDRLSIWWRWQRKKGGHFHISIHTVRIK